MVYQPQEVTIDGQKALAYEIDENRRYVTCRFVGSGKFFIEHVGTVIGLNLETIPKVNSDDREQGTRTA
jgi:hypothetical protein